MVIPSEIKQQYSNLSNSIISLPLYIMQPMFIKEAVIWEEGLAKKKIEKSTNASSAGKRNQKINYNPSITCPHNGKCHLFSFRFHHILQASNQLQHASRSIQPQTQAGSA